MSSLVERVRHLHDVIVAKDTLNAMERFYSDHVVVQENTAPPRIGKAINLKHERRNMERMTLVSAEPVSLVVDDSQELVFSEWIYLFKNREDQHFQVEEVSVQRWLDGLVQHERFYYKEARPVDP